MSVLFPGFIHKPERTRRKESTSAGGLTRFWLYVVNNNDAVFLCDKCIY